MPTPTVHFPFRRESKQPQPRKLNRIADGDTPEIEQPIRMVSADTCEKAGYAGKPKTSQLKLDACRKRLEEGYFPGIPDETAEYLIKKLKPDAAERHISAADAATAAFQELLDTRLSRPDGSRRKAAVIPAGEIIDRYGRLLAYIAPYYANTKTDPLPEKDSPERRTFNLDMIENGWAAFFPIYPSLPSDDDMNLAIRAAEKAWKKKRGAWDLAGPDLLVGYEYRACIKLGTAKSPDDGVKAAFQRACIDLRTKKNAGKFGFCSIPPCYRMWVWETDLQKAIKDLGLKK